MTTRWTYAQVLKELRGALSSLARADVRYRRSGDEWHDAQTTKARTAIADAMRTIRTLRRDAARRREREAA